MANELQFILDTPVAYGAAAAAAAYDAAAGTTIGSAATDGALGTGTVIYQRLSGACGLQIKFVGFVVTVAITGVSAVLSVVVRPTVGANTSARVVGTITVPTASAIGDVCYGTFGDDDISVNPGEEVIVYLSTKSTAGSGYVTAGFSCFLVGPTSGGTATTPKTTVKPYGAVKVGSVKLVTSGTTGN
jgi:hypothetical protein